MKDIVLLSEDIVRKEVSCSQIFKEGLNVSALSQCLELENLA